MALLSHSSYNFAIFFREQIAHLLKKLYFFLRFDQDEKIALYFTTERRAATGIGSMTFGELKSQVSKYSSALRGLGVARGDRVVGYLPNCPEAIIAMAATASIGAIWYVIIHLQL